MNVHPAIKPAIWGAAAGAVAMTVVGFSYLGWTLGSTAEKMADARAESAIILALTPVCVARFEAQADVKAKMAEFKKVTASWDQRSYIEKGGWATPPGSDTPNSAVADACAEKLGKVT